MSKILAKHERPTAAFLTERLISLSSELACR